MLCSVAFVLAPVHRPDVHYSWPATADDPAPVAIPSMTLQPVAVHASVSCAAARAARPGAVLVSTTTLTPAAGREALDGLRVSRTDDGALLVRTAGTSLPAQPVPAAGECTWAVDSTIDRTVLQRDGQVVAERFGDLRPAVAGVFTDSPSAAGLSVDVTADTVFQTSPSALKSVLAALALLSLAAALYPVRRSDRRTAAAVTPAGTPPEPVDAADQPRAGGRLLRWLVDATVVVGLAVWTVIGPLTPDDGYISGIVRSRDANGYVGDVYRWFNAPEAPFGWFYEVLDVWSKLSDTTLWMRVPSSLLGVLTWFLLSRGLLPRLGPFTRRPVLHLAAALTFGAWWFVDVMCVV